MDTAASRKRGIPSSPGSGAASKPAIAKLTFPKPTSDGGGDRMASDEELVARFQRGDAAAYELLVLRWSEPLFHLAFRLTGDGGAAHDLRQMTLLQAHRSLAGFEGRARLATWLYRILLNQNRDLVRRESALGRARARVRKLLRLNGHSFEPSAEHAAARREVADVVARAVLSLPPREREVVVLRHYHDLAFPAIAEVVGAPVTTVKSRMTKGMERLKTRLAGVEPG